MSTDEMFKQTLTCTEDCDALQERYEKRRAYEERHKEVECPKGYVYWGDGHSGGCVDRFRSDRALRSIGL